MIKEVHMDRRGEDFRRYSCGCWRVVAKKMGVPKSSLHEQQDESFYADVPARFEATAIA